MLTRRIIPSALFAISIVMVGSAVHMWVRMDRDFRKAQDEVLLTLDGRRVGNTGKYVVEYRFSHGVLVVNATLAPKEVPEATDVIIACGDAATFLQFAKGREMGVGCELGEEATVAVKRGFRGEMQFKNNVCGCEMHVPLIAIVISSGIALALCGIGVFLWVRKTRDTDGDASPAK